MGAYDYITQAGRSKSASCAPSCKTPTASAKTDSNVELEALSPPVSRRRQSSARWSARLAQMKAIFQMIERVCPIERLGPDHRRRRHRARNWSARALHDLSSRRPCQALRRRQLRSHPRDPHRGAEIFGHEKGACSPAPVPSAARAALSWPKKAPCCSTKSARCPCACRQSFCAWCSKTASCAAWAARGRHDSGRRARRCRARIRIRSRPSPAANFAATSSTGSTCSTSRCRRCAITPPTSPAIAAKMIPTT